MSLVPQLVVVLELNDAIVYERVEQRRFDPLESCFRSIIKEKDTISEEVLSRLIYAPEDTHPLLKKRLLAYRQVLPAIETEFKRNLIRINAEMDMPKITASFCEAIENSV